RRVRSTTRSASSAGGARLVRQGLRAGLVALLLLAPSIGGAQGNDCRVMDPVPPQRDIRARPPRVTPQPPPRAPGAVAPAAGAPPSTGPIDRGAGNEQIGVNAQGLVNLDFQDVELAVVIDTSAKLTNKHVGEDD